jgi:hypothetical protein
MTRTTTEHGTADHRPLCEPCRYCNGPVEWYCTPDNDGTYLCEDCGLLEDERYRHEHFAEIADEVYAVYRESVLMAGQAGRGL